jgi:hypothetical protein
VFGTTQAQAANFTLCTNLSEAAGSIALARDEGMSPGEVFQFGLESGLDADLISAMINLVYIDMVNSSPQHIENTFMAYCLSN